MRQEIKDKILAGEIKKIQYNDAIELIAHYVTKDSNLFLKEDLALWRVMTRRMFQKFPAEFIYQQVEDSLVEAADEQWFDNKYPKHIFQEDKKIIFTGKIKQAINSKLKITEVALKYGLDVHHGKATCPFHNDTDPSLSLSDELNVFHCFGCHAKGDIIEFIRRMEEIKHEKK